jgi:polar amino acid transport system substrate-binding protein
MHPPACLIGALCLLLASAASACGPFRVAYFDYPGLYQRDAEGREFGLDVDLLREVERHSGCRLEARPSSAQRSWQALAEGELDIVVSALQTPEREQHYEFIVMARTRALVLMRKADGTRLRSREAFLSDPEALLLTVRGTRYGPRLSSWLATLKERGRLTEAGDMPSALRAFEGGRAQGLLIYPMALTGRDADWVARHAVQNWWPEEAAQGGWALSRQTLKPAERERLRQAVNTLRRDGTLRRLQVKHLGSGAAVLFVEAE